MYIPCKGVQVLESSIFQRNKGILRTSLRQFSHAERKSIVRNCLSDFCLSQTLSRSSSSARSTFDKIYSACNVQRSDIYALAHTAAAHPKPFLTLCQPAVAGWCFRNTQSKFFGCLSRLKRDAFDDTGAFPLFSILLH